MQGANRPRPSAVVGPLKPTCDLPLKEAFLISSRGRVIPPFISKLRLLRLQPGDLWLGRILRSQNVFSRATQLYRFFDFTPAAQVSRKRPYEWARKTQPTLVRSTRLDVIHSHFSLSVPSHYFRLLPFPFDTFQIRKTGFAWTTAVDRCVLRLSVYQIETDSFGFRDYSVIRFQWEK